MATAGGVSYILGNWLGLTGYASLEPRRQVYVYAAMLSTAATILAAVPCVHKAWQAIGRGKKGGASEGFSGGVGAEKGVLIAH